MKINKKSNKLFLLFSFALIVLITICALIYYSTKNDEQSRSKENTSEPQKPTENRTYETTSEGKDITVPDNVDPSSIKNYRLVTENETYKIRELSGEYYVTLYPIINRPDQSNTYQDQLKEYKQSAIDYLKKNNIDTQKTKIYYEPSEATNL